MSDLHFTTIDAAAISNELIKAFEVETGETFYPGDERRMFLLNFLPVLVAAYNKMDDTGRQNLLRYARGDVLDAFGERLDTPRLEAQQATCIQQFMLSSGHPQVTIPINTRVTPDGKLFFATIDDLTIQPGINTGNIEVKAVDAGAIYNGFAIDQINKLVDSVPYVASVQNTTESSDGSDIESDDDGINIWSGYRERIRQAPNKLTTAGPTESYIFWAKTADVNIQDVAVTSPSAGAVKITVIMKDGELPSLGVLDAVLSICSDSKRRPLTDYVTSSAPSIVNYTINFTYYISASRASEEADIRKAIEDPGGAVDQFVAWQYEKLGRGINPDQLRQLMFLSGAFKITLTAPAEAVVNADAIALISGSPTINYGGLI